MGFGILFIGYIFTVFDMGAMYSDSLGYLFMLGLLTLGWTVTSAGCYKLKRYISAHSRAFTCSVCMSILAAVRLLGYILLKCNVSFAGLNETLGAVNILSAVSLGLFFWFFYTGISSICTETELPKLSKRAIRYRGSALVFSVLDIASCLNLNFADGLAASLQQVRYLYYIILFFLTASLIFKCYMMICLPEDLEMKPREKKKKTVSLSDEEDDGNDGLEKEV